MYYHSGRSNGEAGINALSTHVSPEGIRNLIGKSLARLSELVSRGHILNCELRNGEWAFGRTNQNDERIKVDPLDKKFLSVGLVTQLGIEELRNLGPAEIRPAVIGMNFMG